MYRIDDATAAAALPTPEAAGAEGYWTEGNPATNTPATLERASWFNMVQEEIRNVVIAGGQTPSKTTYNQMLLAIENLIEVRSGNYVLDTGVANAYVVALSPAVTAYTQGLVVRFKVLNANTGASTLNAGGGIVSLVNDVGGALQAADLPAASVVSAVFDTATNAFHILSLVPAQALTQTQADARYAPISVTPTPGAITGLLPTIIAGTNTTAAVTISSGKATDSTGAKILIGPGHNWAVSNGNAANGFDGGTTLPNSSTIHFFECNGSSGYCSFASTSLTPVFPAGYNSYTRRIFSLLTNSAGALLAGTAVEVAGGAMEFYLATQVLDISGATMSTASRTLYTLSVPQGIKVVPNGRALLVGILVSSEMIFTSPDETDVAPVGVITNSAPGFDVGVDASSVRYTAANYRRMTTNTSAQVGARGGGSGTFSWVTSGYLDGRRA